MWSTCASPVCKEQSDEGGQPVNKLNFSFYRGCSPDPPSPIQCCIVCSSEGGPRFFFQHVVHKYSVHNSTNIVRGGGGQLLQDKLKLSLLTGG